MMDKAIKHGLILAAFFWCASALAQTSINVNCATQDLHAALATANANSTAANLYTLNISGTCFANAGTTPGTFTITAPMTLQQDPTATTPAVLDGSALNSLSATTVLVNNATGVRLIGLVVQKGVGPDRLSNGGQIQGGGIFNNGDLQIIKSTIQNNNGGLSGSAGGIENKGNIAIRQSLIANNTASGYGGGLDNSSPLGSNVSISQSTFYQNSAGGGNAIAENSRANTVILTSTFYKNSGDLGAIYSSNDWGTLTISQTTITGNDGRYGGIYIKNGGAYNVTISQSIVANNKGTAVSIIKCNRG